MIVLVQRIFIHGKILLLLVSVIFTFISVCNAYGRAYYVSNKGNNYNNGTIDQPLKTIQNALDKAKAGDIIHIRGGTYLTSQLNLSKRKNDGIGILVIKNFKNETVIVDHQMTIYAWWIRDRSNLTIEGLIIQNAHEGFVILGNSKNVTIKNCIIRNFVNRGVFSHGARKYGKTGYPEKISIVNCEFVNIGKDTAGGDIALGRNCSNFRITENKLHGNVDGVVMQGASSGHIIANNVIYNHKREDGIDLKDTFQKTKTSKKYTLITGNTIYGHKRQTGITVQMGSSGVKINRNSIYSNKWGIWINDSGTKDVEIVENKITKNSIAGIIINQNATGNVRIVNNKIFENGNTKTAQLPAGIIITAGDDYLIKNNVIAANSRSRGPGLYNLQVWIGEKQINSTIMDNNTYYPGYTKIIIKWGNDYYSLSKFQKKTSQAKNSIFINKKYFFTNDKNFKKIF